VAAKQGQFRIRTDEEVDVGSVKSERVFSDFRKAEGSLTVFVFERFFSRDGRE